MLRRLFDREALASCRFTHDYALDTVISPLPGERDRNFRLQVDDGQQFVLKIFNEADPPVLQVFQAEILEHLRFAAPHIPVPKVVRSRNGAATTTVTTRAGNQCVGMVMTFIAGIPSAGSSRKACSSLGHTVGLLGEALSSFCHPGANRETPWHTMQCCNLRPALCFVKNRERRKRIATFFDYFEAKVLPVAAQLGCQIIHNDLNLGNILHLPDRSDELAGIIDFGDAVYAPPICELAILCSYTLSNAPNPFLSLAPLFGAYEKLRPLAAGEFDVLADLILARLALRVVVPSWRMAVGAGDANYIFRAFDEANRLFDVLDRMGAEKRRDALLREVIKTSV